MRIIYLSVCFLFLCVGIVSAQDIPGLRQGVKAPDFEALNSSGERVRLSDVYRNGPVILVFYRGGWCPYCNRQLLELQAFVEQYKEYNASIIAISVDRITKIADTVSEARLDFEVISDPMGEILKKYDLVYVVPDDLNKKYKEEYNIDLEEYSGRDHHMIAIPATYIINSSGQIIFAYANEDYKVRVSPSVILEQLQQIGGNSI